MVDIVIKIENIRYLAHRLAWFYYYGKFPDQMTDHINGIKDDNRICNLRDVNNRTNQENKTKGKRSNPEIPTGVHPRFCKDKTLISYRAVWKDKNGKNKYSSDFNIIKCGSENNALNLALAYRNARIKERISEGALYTERHGYCLGLNQK